MLDKLHKLAAKSRLENSCVQTADFLRLLLTTTPPGPKKNNKKNKKRFHIWKNLSIQHSRTQARTHTHTG